MKKKWLLILMLIAAFLGLSGSVTAEIIPFASHEGVVWFQNEESKKFGLKNPTGKIIIPPTFDGATPFFNGMAVVMNDHLCGVIDKSGNIILPLCFQEIDIMDSNIFAAKDWAFQLYSMDGLLMSDEEFEYYDKVSSYYIISTGGVSGVIDTRGNVWLDQEWLRIRNISKNGWADVADEEGMFNYIQLNGSMMFSEMLEYVTAFSGGFGGIIQRPNDTVCFVNEDGTIIRHTEFYNVDNTNVEGCFKVNGNGTKGLYFPLHDTFINISADEYFEATENRIIVKLNGKWGVSDDHGSLIVPNIYECVDYVSDGIFAAKEENGSLILLDMQGKRIGDLELKMVSYFSEGLLGCQEAQSGLLGFVDTKGVWVIPPIFQTEYPAVFENGVCCINENNRLLYIDHEGGIISYYSDAM